MWIWREDTAGGAFDRDDRAVGGWHVDPYGAWNWHDGPAAPAGGGLAVLPARADVSHAEAGPWSDETPIFNAVSDDHSRRARMHPVEGEAAWAAIPEPHPGSGPLPVQDPSGRARSGHLAAVPTVPPPSVAHDDLPAGSPEDELRRRAERRRRPRTETSGSRGVPRHALRDEEPRGGRHALEG